MRTEEKRMFPLFIDLEMKKVIVIGGGVIAARRIKTMLSFGPSLEVIAPWALDTVEAYHGEGRLLLKKKTYEERDLEGAVLVIAATDDSCVNERIYRDCRRRSIPVNVCSNKELCDFHFPGIVFQDELTIGINASGRNHQKAARARAAIANFLQGETL